MGRRPDSTAAEDSKENRQARHAAVALLELADGDALHPKTGLLDSGSRLGIAGGDDRLAAEGENVCGQRLPLRDAHDAESVRPCELLERIYGKQRTVAQIGTPAQEVKKLRRQRNTLHPASRREDLAKLIHRRLVGALRQADKESVLGDQCVSPVE